MLLPLVYWLVLWAFFLPGPKHGLDLPLTAALLATSMPLVLWFFLANLGFLANSMGGEDEYDRPSLPIVRRIIAVLPWAAVTIGLVSLPLLALAEVPALLVPLPLLSGLAIHFAIHRGEAARESECLRRRQAVGAPPAPEVSPASEVSPLDQGLRRLVGLVYAIPLLGWLIEDAVKGRASAKLFFALNIAILWLAAIAIFGYPAIIVPALAMVPVIFAGLFWTTRA